LDQLESFGVFREVLPTLAKVKGECQGSVVEFGEVAVERAVGASHGLKQVVEALAPGEPIIRAKAPVSRR